MMTWRACSVLGSVVVLACSMPAIGAIAAAAARTPCHGLVLGCSRSIEWQAHAVKRSKVTRALDGLRIGPATTVISPQELQTLLGGNVPESRENTQKALEEVEIEVRAPPGVPERPLQAQIPLGLAGLLWGIRHPRQAWRLFPPVLG